MQGMLEILTVKWGTITTHQTNCSHLASTKLGPWYSRTTSHHTRQPQVRLCDGGILYKMDRGKSSLRNNRKDDAKILLAEHCLSFHSTLQTNSQQWKTILQPRFLSFLRLHRHKGSLHISLPSAIQKSRRACKWQDLHHNQEKAARRINWQVGKLITRSTLGPKHNRVPHDRVHTV